ncbi:hypothetical protein [Glycomyces xiaoerkulensis]|uniref:hypothetical protein n=1 Tax=Glycomyces xiaoerkulensis TaxID=2038139 RepID=UPI000C2645C1|nr:hypothetical protein [Glycomyces xiaoerkulensis]
MTTEYHNRADRVEQRRWVAAHVLLGGSLPMTDTQSALLRQHFPAFAALSGTDRAALREAYGAAISRHVDGTAAGADRVVAEIKAIGTWWGLRGELLRLARDTVNHVQGAGR